MFGKGRNDRGTFLVQKRAWEEVGGKTLGGTIKGPARSIPRLKENRTSSTSKNLTNE